jgi:Amt family ammonium transporter
VLAAAAGAVAGLVGITPAAGFVGVWAALLIGVGAGVFACLTVDMLKGWLQLDDALDVFAVHGIGGLWGALATGLFADSAIGGADGLFFGDARQFGVQVVAVVVVAAFSAIVTFGICKIIAATIGLRVAEDEEVLGLDTSQHGEIAYRL